MRGDIALTLRLLLRPTGLLGLAAAAAGTLAVVGVWLPWYLGVVDVEMLGSSADRVIAHRTGLPRSAPAWVCLVAGAVAAVLGAAVALERPPPWARGGLLVSGAAVAGSAATGLVRAPGTGVVVTDLSRLDQLAARLPVGVELTLSVAPAPALWLTGAVGLVLVGVAAVLRER